MSSAVVAVDEGDDGAGGDVETGIAGVAESAVLLVDDPHAGVTGRPLVAQVGARIGRTIVDEDDLHVVDRLAEDALHTAVEGGLDTVDGDDDA